MECYKALKCIWDVYYSWLHVQCLILGFPLLLCLLEIYRTFKSNIKYPWP